MRWATHGAAPNASATQNTAVGKRLRSVPATPAESAIGLPDTPHPAKRFDSVPRPTSEAEVVDVLTRAIGQCDEERGGGKQDVQDPAWGGSLTEGIDYPIAVPRCFRCHLNLVESSWG